MLDQNEIFTRFYKALTWSNRRRDVIHVTDLSRECLRQSWYAIIHETGYFSADSLIRFGTGTGLHSYPLTKFHELPITWEGIHGSPDEYEDSTLIEKKTTASKIPRNPPDHYIRQTEYYRVLIERGTVDEDFYVRRPKQERLPKGESVKVAYVMYISTTEADVSLLPLGLRNTDVIAAEMLMRRDVLNRHLQLRTPPPRDIGWQCNWCSFASICFGKEIPPLFSYKSDLEHLEGQVAKQIVGNVIANEEIRVDSEHSEESETH